MSQFIRSLRCLLRISSRARVTVFHGSFSVPFAESSPLVATQNVLQSTAPAGWALNWTAGTVTRAAATTPAPTLSVVRLVLLDMLGGVLSRRGQAPAFPFWLRQRSYSRRVFSVR